MDIILRADNDLGFNYPGERVIENLGGLGASDSGRSSVEGRFRPNFENFFEILGHDLATAETVPKVLITEF